MELSVLKNHAGLFTSTIVGFILMLLIVPILAPVLLIFWLLSYATFLFIKIQYGNSVLKPRGMDIVNGKENEVSKPYINVAGRFNGLKPDLDNIKRNFQKKVIDVYDANGERKFKRLLQILEKHYGYYVWKDVDCFNVDNHFNVVDPKVILNKYNELVKETNGGSGVIVDKLMDIDWESMMKILLTIYGAKSMKSGCPKWEVLLLAESEERYTCLFRVHHSITDGIYFVRLIAECLADQKVEINLPYSIPHRSFLIKCLFHCWSFALLPYGLIKIMFNNDRNPLHGEKLCGEKLYHISEKIPLQRLREIKKGVRVTVNDILFSCVSRAAASHFDRRNTSVDQINVLLAMCLQEQNKPLKMKNNFAITTLKIPTFTTDQNDERCKKTRRKMLKDTKPIGFFCLDKFPSLTRLQIVKASLDAAKSDPSQTAICWLLTTFSSLLPASVSEALLSTEGITLDVSNVQGPINQDLSIASASAIDVCFWLPDRDPLGIGVSISSYDGYLRMGLIVDKSIIGTHKEASEFLNDCVEEIYNLHSEVRVILSNVAENDKEVSRLLPNDIP